MKQSARRWQRILSYFLFIIYLIVLCYFLFFSEAYGRNEGAGAYRYNLVLFREIKRFYQYRDIIGSKSVLINLFGNVAAFVPYGFFLPLLWPRMRRLFWILCSSLCFSLLVESIQLLYQVGTFDVDDLFLNTLGGVFGYILLQLFLWRRRAGRNRKKR